jgi:hypothetical protein
MKPDPTALGAQEHFARDAEPRRPRLVGAIQKLTRLADGEELHLQVGVVPNSDPSGVSADRAMRHHAKVVHCFMDFAARHLLAPLRFARRSEAVLQDADPP